MTLLQFLKTLATEGVKIQLVDEEGKEIIKFFSEGYEGVEGDILARTVKKLDLTGTNTISIVLKDTE